MSSTNCKYSCDKELEDINQRHHVFFFNENKDVKLLLILKNTVLSCFLKSAFLCKDLSTEE